MRTLLYTHRGPIERPCRGRRGRPSYRWTDGFSETSPNGGVTYPWMTRRECQADARAQGAKAKFV